MNSLCALIAELHIACKFAVDQPLISANLQIELIGHRNIGKIPYRCITNTHTHTPCVIITRNGTHHYIIGTLLQNGLGEFHDPLMRWNFIFVGHSLSLVTHTT